MATPALQCNDAPTALADSRAICAHCGALATVYVRSNSAQYSAPTCDAKALEVEAWAIPRGHEFTLSRIHGSPLLLSIDGVTLADHVRETMDCVNHDLPASHVTSIGALHRTVRIVLEARLRRTLTPTERANLTAETTRVIAGRRRPVSAVVAELEAGKRRTVPMQRIG